MRSRRTLIGMVAASAVTAVTLVTLVGTWPAQAQIAGGINFTQPQTIASNLVAPWGLAFLPDGSAVVSERDSARILQLRQGQAPQVIGNLPGVVPGGEGGLMGLAVSPTYAQDQWVYAMFTAASDNRIVRFRLNAIGSPQTVLTGMAKATIHNGGRIAFGPDGMLYAGIGDAGNTSNSQNTSSLNGKILRMTPTGGVPSGNPFNSLVYSYGHRNVQGLAWDGQNRLYATEFGQNTTDEINMIVAGGNYGWPTCEGNCSNPNFRNPIVTWSTAQASPSGLAFANGHLFAAALRGQRLWVVPLNSNGTAGTPIAELQSQFGRLRAVARAPDGSLWVATSNRDGRGTPAATDDRVLRFPPVGPSSPPPSSPGPSSPPPSSPPPSSPPPSSPPPGACSVILTVQSSWATGYVIQPARVTNTSNAQITWVVRVTLPAGHTSAGFWNATQSISGQVLTFRGVSWNGTLAPGASGEFGFQINRPSGNTATPTATCSTS